MAAVLLVAFLVLGGAAEGLDLNPARGDTMYLQLWPHATELAPGDTLDVDLIVPVAGLPFNAYDAYVGYDPEALTFLQRPNLVDQEGPLMRDVCGQTFHVFQIAPDSTHLRIGHSLLCPGEELTGPGVVYRLRFRCNDVETETWLRLLGESPTLTRAYNDGLFVQPLVTIDALVQISDASSTVPPAPRAGPWLRAAPNPFNPQTVFIFALDETAAGELRVYGLDGRLLRTLAAGLFAAGEHTARWDGTDDAGRSLAAGVYLARLHTGTGAVSTRVCLVR